MDIVTITSDAKRVITDLCNKALLTEYDMIVSYPRLIDHLTNFEKIKDKQLIQDISNLGKESLGHFQKTTDLITRLGYQTAWRMTVLPRLVGISDELEKQLAKESFARNSYQEAKKVAMNNKTTIRGREFFGRTFRVRSGIGEDVVTADEIINTIDRLRMDEERHARLVKDSIATISFLMKK